ncbi:Signal transduction histidine kinase [Jatrophihabitans endophyticus]|uniref:histidine kinase n=1 Tax=Jatrophihabitans endophyticus TaxID=1206085 RepID=A0A1M5CLC2_9ACTN|nr:histidine kinase [Jatrophihabitans endophyticus]SHF55501.1 Signal transduction histidine kinase [Jatrophihabitans endophyticus]
MRSWRGRVVDVALAGVVLLVGVCSLRGGAGPGAADIAVLVLAATAAGIARHRPALAVALAWLVGAVQLAGSGRTVGELVVACAVVAFAAARHGGRPTVLLAGVSAPLGVLVALGWAVLYPGRLPGGGVATWLTALTRLTGAGIAGATVAAVAVLLAPWVLGLLLRQEARYRQAEAAHQVEQVRIAALAESQAERSRLTREVHDVVGHSLAVIIAQADAARLASADPRDPAASAPLVRDVLERIAVVGRSSLAEVRDVLSRTAADGPVAAAAGDPGTAELDTARLVDGVRAAGNVVTESVTGAAVPLDVAHAAAAYRVLQEFLTNALKHGGQGEIEVDQVWAADALTLRVTNPAAATVAGAATGTGLAGVTSRLDPLGGSVRTTHARGRFVAVARLPLSADGTS